MQDSSQKLKSLQTFLREAADDQYRKRDALRVAQHEEAQASARVQRLKDEINALTIAGRDLVVTEHAFLRFFERVLGYDLEKVKEEIMPKNIRERMLGKPYMDYRVGDSHTVTIKDGKILTVMPQFAKPARIQEIVDDEPL
jgi:hypothetical protein